VPYGNHDIERENYMEVLYVVVDSKVTSHMYQPDGGDGFRDAAFHLCNNSLMIRFPLLNPKEGVLC
jgi:hypothetical protein